MGLVAAVTAAFSLWIILWSMGTKALDAFLITLVIVLVSATVRAIIPNLPGRQVPPGD
jgi:Mn2+/Fe2+ NRAMP family transporter